MVDYNGIDQDERITKEGDISAVELRRARLGVEGVVYYDWKYKFEIEFAGDEVEIKDAYLAYANWWEVYRHVRDQDRQPVCLYIPGADHQLALHHLLGARRFY